MPPRALFPRAALLLLLVLLTAPSAQARLGDAEFRKIERAARRVMGKPGEWAAKLALLEQLAPDDSLRSTQLVFGWDAASRALNAETLVPEAAKRKQALEEYERRVVAKRGQDRAAWKEVERSRLEKRAVAWRDAVAQIEVEQRVQAALAHTVEQVRDAEAQAWIATTGVPGLLAERADGLLLQACFARLLDGPPEAVQEAVLAVLARPIGAVWRIRGLEWIGRHRPHQAAVRLGPCLVAPSVAVQRAALRVLRRLDDSRAVPVLIQALSAMSGLAAAETETLLQRFTGKRFAGDATAWARWWSEEGESWLAALDAAKRFDPLHPAGGVSFYGIRTPSNRIAFVLDRSGSMKAPAIWNVESRPFTPEDGKESWAGKTRLEVAKVQLARTINNLATDVRFTILFYDYEVDIWREPPTLVEASRENKAEAQRWFMPLEPGSSTSMFDGLMKALEYAEDLDAGASGERDRIDTIFLLSDGAPTHFRGKPLNSDADVDAAYAAFREANGLRRIVVHAIGVGQGHNEALMRRMASDSGGKYVAVGMD